MPDYRLIPYTGAVRHILAAYLPVVIEALFPWALPWPVIRHLAGVAAARSSSAFGRLSRLHAGLPIAD